MSRGLGRIGRAIAHSIECARLPDPITGRRGMVISSLELLYDVYPGAAYDFTLAQRKAVTRAMHDFVRRHPQFALAGGQGRKRLYLYAPDDPLSVMWMRRKLSSPNPPSETDLMVMAVVESVLDEGTSLLTGASMSGGRDFKP